VADIKQGGGSSSPGYYMEILVGDTLYFDAEWTGSSTKSLVAFSVGSGSGSGSGGPSNGPVTNAVCEISPTLPAVLTLTQGTCTISGTPTESQDNTNYILWINESGVLDAAFVNIEVQDPEQIDLSPDDITTLLTNNTTMSPMTFNWVVSGTGSSGTTTSYGEGSVWQAVHINPGSNDSEPGFKYNYFSKENDAFVLVGENIYFPADGYDACSSYCKNTELWAYNPTNGTAWEVADIHPGDYSAGNSSSSNPGYYGYEVVGTTLYFTAQEESGYSADLWAHNDSNGTTWQVKNFTYSGSSVGRGLGITLVGTTLYFDADDGGLGRELWAHDTSNGNTWRVADIAIGIGSGVYVSDRCSPALIGTTLFFG